MAKSNARKNREKLVREGIRNPSENRSIFANSDVYKRMTSKKTKTKKELLNKKKYKGDYHNQDDNGSFYFN